MISAAWNLLVSCDFSVWQWMLLWAIYIFAHATIVALVAGQLYMLACYVVDEQEAKEAREKGAQ